MRKYNLVLQGGINIVISDTERAEIVKMEEEAVSKDFTIELGNNRFKKSMVKGIFEIKEEVSDNKEAWIKSNHEWNNLCLTMSKRSAEDKTAIEIDNRILNILNHDPASLPTDPEMAVIYANILQFFKDNPKYPRCPSRIWWPFIKEKVKSSMKLSHDGSIFKKWWYLVSANDNAIAEWIKYQPTR